MVAGIRTQVLAGPHWVWFKWLLKRQHSILEPVRCRWVSPHPVPATRSPPGGDPDFFSVHHPEDTLHTYKHAHTCFLVPRSCSNIILVLHLSFFFLLNNVFWTYYCKINIIKYPVPTSVEAELLSSV